MINWTVITGIAASAAVVVAFLQWMTAQTKLALDIHATRYAIYKELREIVIAFGQNNLKFSNELQGGALELLLNIAARRHDAHVLGHQHIRDGKLCWRPHKTLRTTSKMLKVRLLPEFQAALDAMPSTDSLTFLVNDYARPFATAAAFGNKFADWCKAAGLKPVM